MTKTTILKNPVGLLLLAALLTGLSYFYLDADLSLFIHRLIRRSVLWARVASGVPDLLLHLVVVVTVLSWTGYFLQKRRGAHDRQARFLRACGTVVPMAFAAKYALQYLFGRPDPRLWVFYHVSPRFHWFRAGRGFGSFPSGHMTVITALMSVLSNYYPRYRYVFLVTLFMLGLALIATNYHYLSDVIAGAGLGAVVAFYMGGKKFSESVADERA